MFVFKTQFRLYTISQMRVCIPPVWLLVFAANVAHAQTAPASKVAAAMSGKSDLENFITAYLVGFVVSVGWLAFRAWRGLRKDVRALRGGR